MLYNMLLYIVFVKTVEKYASIIWYFFTASTKEKKTRSKKVLKVCASNVIYSTILKITTLM